MVKEHKTVSLFNPFIKKDEEIDENIAELIECLWKLDIETSNSCENNVPLGYIWIEFLCGYDAEKFLDIVGRFIYKDKADVYKVDDLYQRMNRPSDESPNQWLYNCDLMDCSEKVINDYTVMDDEFCGFALPISVRFPIKDYPVVLKSLKKELKEEIK
ncbi:MAG: hypothetical protein MUO82_07630 [Candidatus Thermoplasmatota archaeon]|nr:hypothetical protein [Candidatus Thermoplasmatota archaeon]